MVSNVNGPKSYRGPGSVESFKIILKNVDSSKSYDITSMVTDVSLYEDIFKKAIYGVIAIKDGINLMNGMTQDKQNGTSSFPIVGEEFIEMSYTVSGFEQVNRRFAVNAIKQVTIDKTLKSRNYVIDICSEEYLIDATTLVQKSYQDQISNMVEDILKKYLKVDKEIPNAKRKKAYDIQATKGQQNLVIPRLTPFETLDFLAKRSLAETVFQSGSYLFFENKDGFNFCDIEYLIRRGKQRYSKDITRYQYYYQDPNLPNPTHEGSGVQDDSKTFKTVISMVQKHKFDTIEKLRRGYFENDVLVYDFVAKRVKETVFKFLDHYQDLNTLGASKVESVSEASYPENSIDFIRTVTKDAEKPQGILGFLGLTKDFPSTDKHTKLFFIPKDSTQPDTYLETIYSNRASYMTRLAQNMFTVEVIGDPLIAAGDVITINLPEIIGTTIDRKIYDVFLSGYFMVTTIHHRINSDSYMCTYDLYKNGFSNPVITTDKGEAPQPSSSAFLNNTTQLGVNK